MSIKYLNKAFECKAFKSMEKLLMIAICDSVNDDGFGYPGYKKLMVKTSMAKATLSKHIKILKDAGIFDVEPHGNIGEGRKVNTYQVHQFWNFQDLMTRLDTSRNNRKVQGVNLSQDARKVQSAKSSRVEPRKVQGLNPKSSRVEHEPSVLTISKEPSVEVIFPENLHFESWDKYLEHRKAYKFKKLKPHSEQALINELSELPIQNQIDCVKETMRNGWQGLFPHKHKPKDTPKSKPNIKAEIFDRISKGYDGEHKWKSPEAQQVFNQMRKQSGGVPWTGNEWQITQSINEVMA